MKPILLTIAMMLVVPTLIFSQGNGKGVDKKGGAEQSVRQTITDLAAALGRNDVAALDRIYGDDYIVINENGVMTDKATRLASIKSGDLKFGSVVFTELKVNVYGDTAVARFRSDSKVQSTDAQALGGDLRVTTTLVRSRGRWQVVAAHVTRITEK